MKQLFKTMFSRFPEFLEVAGVGAVAYGASLVYVPAGVIVAGIGAILLGVAFSSGESE